MQCEKIGYDFTQMHVAGISVLQLLRVQKLDLQNVSTRDAYCRFADMSWALLFIQ